LGAGSETVGNTFSHGAFHVMNNPAISRKLFEELKLAWPDLHIAPTFEDLEKLPYLVSLHWAMR
jgi:Cytochrome P450